MQLKNEESKRLNSKRDKLDQANIAETKNVRGEISRIKRAYIKKYGMPKHQNGIRLDGIAPPANSLSYLILNFFSIYFTSATGVIYVRFAACNRSGFN